MNIEKIISVTGKSGLYKIISQSKGAIIVEDLENGKKSALSIRNQVSMLENISIYTQEGEKPIQEVFESMYAFHSKSPIDKENLKDTIKSTFEEILPDYDKDKVYESNLKKLFQWFFILENAGLLQPEKKSKKKAKNEEK